MFSCFSLLREWRNRSSCEPADAPNTVSTTTTSGLYKCNTQLYPNTLGPALHSNVYWCTNKEIYLLMPLQITMSVVYSFTNDCLHTLYLWCVSEAVSMKKQNILGHVKHVFIGGWCCVGYVTCGCGRKWKLEVNKQGDNTERGLQELLSIGQVVIVHLSTSISHVAWNNEEIEPLYCRQRAQLIRHVRWM